MGSGVTTTGANPTTTTSVTDVHLLKKRKMDNVFTVNTVSDSSDEGLGSMSPEPANLNATGKTTANATPKDIIDLKNLLEAERRQKAVLEERLRQIELQIFPDGGRRGSINQQQQQQQQSVTYQHQEVIEHTDNVRPDDEQDLHQSHMGHVSCHADLIENLPDGVCLLEDNSQTESMDEDDIISGHHEQACVKEEYLLQDSSRPCTPVDTIVVRQPILEAVIKAEPKVEVERINAPAALLTVRSTDDAFSTPSGSDSTSTAETPTTAKQRARIYMTAHNTSRQNLETIVEAIRHLEGDQLFGEMTEPTQEVPLALTNKPVQPQQSQSAQPTRSHLQLDMNRFLQFRPQPTAAQTGIVQQHIVVQMPPQQQMSKANIITSKNNSSSTTVTVIPASGSGAATLIKTISVPQSPSANVVSHLQQQQQCRPGVIVVKQNS